MESAEKKFYIYYADWDEWGRTSKNCNGWGLCNFRDCWFCCVDEKGNIVRCKDQTIVSRAAKIIIEEGSKDGEMIVELKPEFQDQQEAIDKQSALYLDEELRSTQFILHKAEYQFDATVGVYGGYKVKVSLIQ